MLKGHYTDKEAIPQLKYGSTNTTMRWLLSREDGAGNFAMRVVRIEKDGFVGMHRHPYEHEIFILSGIGIAKEATGQEEEINPGDFFFIEPDVEHSFINTGDEPLELICCIPDKGY
ncbi:cupin domain-containing protein [bacterium]|nr:cupin domain-containing protein [bacterium]